MASKVSYKASIAGDLKRLDKPAARRVIERLERVLSQNPNTDIPLTGEFRGLFKLRVGDYRVVYAKTEDGVLILRIGHRKDVYR